MYLEEKKLGESKIIDEVGKLWLEAADYIERTEPRGRSPSGAEG
jgi:hypothetical protein